MSVYFFLLHSERERERDRARVRVGQQECSIERDKRMAIALFMWPYNIVGSLVGLGEAAGVGPEVGVLGRSGAVQRVVKGWSRHIIMHIFCN